MRQAVLILTIIYGMPFWSRGQDDERAYYNWFDQTIGLANTGLYSGIEYRDLYRGNNEQPKFFQGPNFVSGDVIYDQQPFYDVDLLYDVFGDEILVRNKRIADSPIVKLAKNKVGGFTIAGHRFINLELYRPGESAISGYFEELFVSDRYTFYKKHLKRILRKSEDGTVYYTFKDRPIHYIHYNHGDHRISSERDLLNLFPGHKKELQIMYERHKQYRKQDPDQYFIAILKDLAKILSVETKNPQP